MKIDWERFSNKLLYNISSRSFFFLLVMLFMYIITTFKFLVMPASEAPGKQFVFDGVQYATMFGAAIFLGKTSFQNFLEKNKKE